MNFCSEFFSLVSFVHIFSFVFFLLLCFLRRVPNFRAFSLNFHYCSFSLHKLGIFLIKTFNLWAKPRLIHDTSFILENIFLERYFKFNKSRKRNQANPWRLRCNCLPNFIISRTQFDTWNWADLLSEGTSLDIYPVFPLQAAAW